MKAIFPKLLFSATAVGIAIGTPVSGRAADPSTEQTSWRRQALNCEGVETAAADPSYPFEDKYVRIGGHRIHYVEEGHGRPILFIHGNPTWSYLWRNVFPQVAKRTGRRAIAIDLLGMGKSDKPVLDYTPQLHTAIVSEFIDKLHLRDVILVGHGWGGAIATNYAVNHPRRIDALVYMEAFTWKWHFADFGFAEPFIRIERSAVGQDLIVNDPTWFADNLIRFGVLDPSRITDDIFARYLEPFPTPESRSAIAQFPRLTAIIDDPASLPASLDFFDEIERKRTRLARKHLLWIVATPGGLVSDASRNKFDAFRAPLTQLDVREFGQGLHHLQEENPNKLACMITSWIREKGLSRRRDAGRS